MSEKKSTRKRWVTVRVTEEEMKLLQEKVKHSTAQTISEYARDVILQKPITVYYRNLSLDETRLVLVKLKNELNAIGHNYNQAIKALHILSRTPNAQAPAAIVYTAPPELLHKLEEIHHYLQTCLPQ